MLSMKTVLAVALLSVSAVSNISAFQVATTTSTSSSRTTTPLKAVQDTEDDSRRTFMASSMAAVAASFLGGVSQAPAPAYAAAAAAKEVDYKAVASDIMALVKKNPDYGPSKLYCSRSSKRDPSVYS